MTETYFTKLVITHHYTPLAAGTRIVNNSFSSISINVKLGKLSSCKTELAHIIASQIIHFHGIVAKTKYIVSAQLSQTLSEWVAVFCDEYAGSDEITPLY